MPLIHDLIKRKDVKRILESVRSTVKKRYYNTTASQHYWIKYFCKLFPTQQPSVTKLQISGPHCIEETDTESANDGFEVLIVGVKKCKPTWLNCIPPEGFGLLKNLLNQIKITEDTEFSKNYYYSSDVQRKRMYRRKLKIQKNSLSPVFGKIFSGILARRLRGRFVFHKVLLVSQAGICKGKRTLDNLFINKDLLINTWEAEFTDVLWTSTNL